MSLPTQPTFIHRPERRAQMVRSAVSRRGVSVCFVVVCSLTAAFSLLVLGVLLYDIVSQGTAYIWRGTDGSFGARLSAFASTVGNFLSNPPSQTAADAGVFPSLMGTVWVCAVCGLVALPLGVATALFLEEFRPKNRWLRHLHAFVQLNITNLAGVPSVVYGIIGMTVFVYMFMGSNYNAANPLTEFGVKRVFDQYGSEGYRSLQLPAESRESEPQPLQDGMTVYDGKGNPVTLILIKRGERPLPTDDEELRRTIVLEKLTEQDADGNEVVKYAEPGRTRVVEEHWYYFRLPFHRSVLAGGLTLMLVVLPIVIISSQEAIRAVPNSLREAALGMGCTPWQVVRRVTLPTSVPGIMTGAILAMSRAIGEAAPILMIAGVVYVSSAPKNLMDQFTVMPLQIYNWASDSHREFHDLAATGIIVLLVVLLFFNSIAVVIRQKFQKNLG